MVACTNGYLWSTHAFLESDGSTRHAKAYWNKFVAEPGMKCSSEGKSAALNCSFCEDLVVQHKLIMQ